MKFRTTISVMAASLGILASGLGAHAGDSSQPATVMPGHGAAPPVEGAWGQQVTAEPVNHGDPALQLPAQQLQQPVDDTNLQPPQQEFGHRGRHHGGPGRDDLDHCRCENLELFVPKEKASEAWLLDAGAPFLRFVNVRIPIGHRVKCTPVDQFQGCAAYLIVDHDKSAVSWNGNVKNLSILPMKLGCPGKCDGNWHSGESWFTYSGWVLGAWPTGGTLHLRVVGTGCDEVQDADIWATVTFSGVPGSPGAVSGTVDVSYAFSSSHAGN